MLAASRIHRHLKVLKYVLSAVGRGVSIIVGSLHIGRRLTCLHRKALIKLSDRSLRGK